MIEKRWQAISPQYITSDGNNLGHISVSDATVFRVYQQVILSANNIASRDNFEVKRIVDATTLVIGPKDGILSSYSDLSLYKSINAAYIAANEQLRSKVPEQEIERYTYEESPVVARRVVAVDGLGNQWNHSNPFPIVGEVSLDENVVITTEVSNLDAFGRTKVAEPFTLGDYKHIYGLDPALIDRTVSGGTVVFSANKSCATLTTNSSPTSLALHQTRAYHHYQPGKSQMILSSIRFGYAQQNVTKRNGYYDDRDGIYFEQVGSSASSGIDNGQLNFVIRSCVSGVASEDGIGSYIRRVPQASWNRDTCDGNGPSGFNIDVSKTALFYIDFQWLGVGRVRCGFVHNGELIIAHEYYHSNILDTVYMSNPNLPIRCEIFNTGTTSGGSMDQICSTVASEGGYVENGTDWAVNSGLRTTSVPSATPLPIIAIRLKNSFNGYPNRMIVRPNNFSMYAETNSIQYELVKLPDASSLTGTVTWVSADDSSGVEYCITASGYIAANADRLANGFVPSGASQNSLSPVSTGSLTSAKKNFIAQNIDSNNSEVYAIIVKTIVSSGNSVASASVALQWREIY